MENTTETQPEGFVPESLQPDSKEVKSKTNLSFGHALKALEEGKMISRSGWNGKGLFVFKQVPATISEDIVPKMQSLPQSVKDELAKRFADNTKESTGGIHYKNQLALVDTANNISGWAPSTPDALANDWCILD